MATLSTHPFISLVNNGLQMRISKFHYFHTVGFHISDLSFVFFKVMDKKEVLVWIEHYCTDKYYCLFKTYCRVLKMSTNMVRANSICLAEVLVISTCFNHKKL